MGYVVGITKWGRAVVCFEQASDMYLIFMPVFLYTFKYTLSLSFYIVEAGDPPTSCKMNKTQIGTTVIKFFLKRTPHDNFLLFCSFSTRPGPVHAE